MREILNLLSSLISIYMMLIFIRIILSWFSNVSYGGIQEFLGRITDPYLNWFRRFSFLRVGVLDLSPIVALAFLSLVNRFFATLVRYGSVSIGIIFAMMLQAVWGAVSFFIGFLIILLLLRLAAYLFRQSNYSPFWRIINTYSQPVIFRINRILFRNRIVNFRTGLIVSIISLILVYLAARILVVIVSGMLAALPF